MPDPMGEPARLSAHRPVSLRHRQEAKPRLKPAPPGQSRSLTSASGGRRLPGCHIGNSRDLAGASRLHPAARHPPPLGVERPSWHVHGRGPADPWPRGSGRGADMVTANAGPSSCVGVASNLGLQCRNNRQAQKTNVVGTHNTGDAAPLRWRHRPPAPWTVLGWPRS